MARASSANMRDRDKKRGQTQVHGLGPTPVEPLRKIEEHSMPRVEEVGVRYSKTCVKRPLKNRQNKDHNDNGNLTKVEVLQNVTFCNSFDLY